MLKRKPRRNLLSTLMLCERRTVLLKAYNKASKFYSFSVSEIQSIRATASKEAYDNATRLSEDARKECNLARRRLDAHTRTHRCWPMPL